MRGISFVDQLTRVPATAFCDEYLEFDIKGRNLWLDIFEEQHTVAMFAVGGWQRFNEGSGDSSPEPAQTPAREMSPPPESMPTIASTIEFSL